MKPFNVHSRVNNTSTDTTYKVFCATQPLGAVFLQQTLQQVSGCVGNVGLQLQRLVQDVVVHLCRVAAVERRLGRNKKKRETREGGVRIKTLANSKFMEMKL